MAALAARRGRHAVPTFPGTQGRRRYADEPAGLVNRKAALVRHNTSFSGQKRDDLPRDFQATVVLSQCNPPPVCCAMFLEKCMSSSLPESPTLGQDGSAAPVPAEHRFLPALEDPLAADTTSLSQPRLAPSGPGAGGWSCETGFVSDLLVRCGRDDQGALALLYDLLCPIVTAAVSMSVDQPRVSDCVRDVFVEVWRDAPAYHSGPVSAVEWIMDRVATGSGRLDPPGGEPGRSADAG